MFWMALMMAGSQGGQGQASQIEAKTAKFVEQQNAAGANILRTANNELAAARGSLARYSQSLNNKQHLKNAGRALNNTSENLSRLAGAYSEGAMNQRITAAEEAGALAARSAASGVLGGTNQMLNATVGLRQARIEKEVESHYKAQRQGLEQQRDGQIEAMVLGLDQVDIFDDLNYLVTQPRHIAVPSTGQILGKAAMTFMSAYSQYGGSFGGGAKASTPKVDYAAPIDGYNIGPVSGNFGVA